MAEGNPSQPSLPWRIGSCIVMGVTGTLSRMFLFGVNTTEVHGLGGFLELLEQRRDIDNRRRGLITGGHSCLSFPDIGR